MERQVLELVFSSSIIKAAYFWEADFFQNVFQGQSLKFDTESASE